jgi:GTP-dependent phosphoenolpyruvate carboxykinase
MEELLAVDPALWQREMQDIGEYLRSFGSRVPARLLEEHRKVLERLGT